ncbi:TrbG/VirB9 family P-type conjugative transfer protein [Serratia marcescens]|nr:TrbG/VirB9 family P-type conjugative transfer protein [Serratia marcescens]CVG51547.1 conjugal transfer protein TrbG [Serratia marcescens]
MPTGQNLANLDFGFRIGGDSPSWKPVRVYTDGSKTYIQFPSSSFNGEAPALVAKGNDGGLFSKASEKLVNYRPIGDRYVVDKVLDRASLIVGVGRNQTEVTITRTGGK